MNPSIVKIKDLRVEYRNRGPETASKLAVNGLNLEVRLVEIFGFLGEQEAARSLFHDMQSFFPDLQPKNRIFYVTLKPIDDVLAARRLEGNLDGPANVEEIFSLLKKGTSDQAN